MKERESEKNKERKVKKRKGTKRNKGEQSCMITIPGNLWLLHPIKEKRKRRKKTSQEKIGKFGCFKCRRLFQSSVRKVWSTN